MRCSIIYVTLLYLFCKVHSIPIASSDFHISAMRARQWTEEDTEVQAAIGNLTKNQIPSVVFEPRRVGILCKISGVKTDG